MSEFRYIGVTYKGMDTVKRKFVSEKKREQNIHEQ